MPRPLPAGVHAMATDKKSCAIYNKSNGEMSAAVADDNVKAADEVVADGLDDHSPLVTIYQTGSGSQTI